MKILNLEVETFNGEVIIKTFIGNDFSPDPMDVQNRIISRFKPSQLVQETFSRDLDVYCLGEEISTDEEDVLAILTKAGYTEYQPVTVRLFIAEDSK